MWMRQEQQVKMHTLSHHNNKEKQKTIGQHVLTKNMISHLHGTC
jgi:hypothetical protein